MGQKSGKVHDGVYDHLSTPPKPSTNTAVHPPRPSDETPVGAGEDEGGEGEEDEDKKKSKKWWKRLTSFFKPAKEPLPMSNSNQQQDEAEQSKVKVAWPGRSSDDYIFSHYSIEDKLGRGSFGVVYEGRRLDDGLKVALKYVTKTEKTKYILIPDHPNPLPKEIALTLLANKGPNVPEIISLLDWQDQPDHFVMVLECPSPCETLTDFIRRHNGSLDEDLTRHIMRQTVHAANMCCFRGVFHRDIKPGNLLINRETSQIKLIDFGCGDILTWSPYTSYSGTASYSPPEFYIWGKYYGRPATVWSLGVVMFILLCGRLPGDYDLYLLKYKQWYKPGISKDCCCLLRELLHTHQSGRIGLGDILSHNWFKVVT